MPNPQCAAAVPEFAPPFAILESAPQRAPVVLCSPHSGRIYPPAFLASSRLDSLTLRRSEDCYVDELFRGVAELGAPMIAARFPRAYLDVNREPWELDPALFLESPPGYANTQSARVLGGLGTLARVVADGEDIYRERLPLAAAFERIETLYFPFHGALGELVETTRRKFGFAILIDCHSMPSASMGAAAGARPDFVLGDRFGVSCDGRLTHAAQEALRMAGYNVQVNRPYAGGYITEHYGQAARDVHALQFEINRGLYMNEATFAKTDGFSLLERNLGLVFERLFARLPGLFGWRTAAE